MELSSREKIALSTLKFNARVLRELGLINFNGFVKLTEFGNQVLSLLEHDAMKQSKGGENCGK